MLADQNVFRGNERGRLEMQQMPIVAGLSVTHAAGILHLPVEGAIWMRLKFLGRRTAAGTGRERGRYHRTVENP